MTIKTLAVTAVAAGCVAMASPGLAHHGASGYDNAKLTVLKATITTFRWMNPHSEVQFDAADETGEVRHWAIEAPPPTMLTERGWNRRSLKEGDVVTLHFNRARNGAMTGILRRVVLPNGEDLWAYPPPDVLEKLTTGPQ